MIKENCEIIKNFKFGSSDKKKFKKPKMVAKDAAKPAVKNCIPKEVKAASVHSNKRNWWCWIF